MFYWLINFSQSTPDFWEHFTRETLQTGEATRQRSVVLRGTLDAILTNAARDLRSQADRVDMALSRRIGCTEEIRIRLENELKKVRNLFTRFYYSSMLSYKQVT